MFVYLFIFTALMSQAMSSKVNRVVQIYTSDMKHAGSDDEVSIQLFGTGGRKSRAIKLGQPANDFQQGQTDTFNITTEDIGTIEKIIVTAGKGGDGWHLNMIEVADEVFPCDCWIDGDDPKTTTVMELFKIRTNAINRVVHICTSDMKQADTDDDVFIQLMGNRGKSRVIKLNNPGNDFNRGRTDTFKITTEDIGTIEKIIVTAGKGGDGWHLNKIEVANEAEWKAGFWKRQVFSCDCWIDGNDNQTTTVKKLFTSRTDTKTRWNVKTYTSTKHDAGTDQKVFIQVYGPGHTSSRIELALPGKNPFEAGQTDNFTVVADYKGGKPSGIVVWAGTQGDSWHLIKMELQIDNRSGSSTNYVFPCDCWFNADDLERYVPRMGTGSG